MLALKTLLRKSYQKYIIAHKDIGKVMLPFPNWLSVLKFLKPRLNSGLRNKRCGKYIYDHQSISRDHIGPWIDPTTFIRQTYCLTIARKVFKYILVVVDVASRYIDAEPLSKKDSVNVEKAFEKFYSRKLTFPRTLIVDPGTEFKGEVT